MDNLNDIIKGCVDNNRVSQEKLYKQFFPVYYALCKQFFTDDHDALTALNNGMLRIFQNISQFDASKGDFFNWGYTIIRHAAISAVKQQIKPLALEEMNLQIADESAIGTFHSDDTNTGLLADLMHFLPLPARTVCRLFYYEDYSIRDISTELGLREGTVKWYLSEGRNQIKMMITNRKHSRYE